MDIHSFLIPPADTARRKGPNDHPDYTEDWFDRSLRERFDVVRSETLAGGQRTLHLARARS